VASAVWASAATSENIIGIWNSSKRVPGSVPCPQEKLEIKLEQNVN